MSEICPSDDVACKSIRESRIVRSIELGDTTYELIVGPCKCCESNVYGVVRSCGASLSIYHISPEDAQNIDEYVSQLHASFALDVTTKMEALRKTIQEFNSNGFFEAEGIQPFAVRLIDKARLICNRFSKNGLLLNILANADDPANDIAAAFILGCIATEHHWRNVHEDAVFEGYAHIQGREAGRPLALAARLRQGKRTRNAVRVAAAKLCESNPLLRRNDSKAAMHIASMKLEPLRKRDGTFLGAEAVVKHLRAIRRASES
jgi:hypothetical protein